VRNCCRNKLISSIGPSATGVGSVIVPRRIIAALREALAIVWSVKLCRPCVERTKFLMRSDHQALKWLFSVGSTYGNPRIMRWKLALAAFDFNVDYKRGSTQRVADELSRMQTEGLSPVQLYL
jgi:RNase H-like domain found in reverse transcriptase